MPPSPGKPVGQGSVQPQEDGGPHKDGEEEDRLAAKNCPEDIQIPDGREPGPIDQEVTRQAQYDEAGHDDYDSDRDASSWHYPASLLCSPSSRPVTVGLGAGGGWKGDASTVRPPDRQPRPQCAARGTVLTATRSAHIIRQFPDEEAQPSYQKPNWPAGSCRRPLPLPRRATAAPGAGRLLSAPARARIATRLAGPRFRACWKPGDPALISLPGKPTRRTVDLPLSIVKIRF